MLVALLLCLVGIAVAQKPVPCTTPPQWEARFFESDEEMKFQAEGILSYDATYRRERIADEVDQYNRTDFYDVLRLFDSRVEFVYNFRARNCSRREITRPWRDFGIRSNATSYGEAYIGSSAFPGSGVLVTIWGGNITTSRNETVAYISSWTYQGCVPVDQTSFGRDFGVAHLSFYDVTVGIRDPNVFIPRRECLSNEEWANRYTLFGKPGDM